MSDSGKLFLGCSIFGVLLITSIILFSCSFSIVKLEEWGIIYDKNYQEVETDPHDSGRYLAGLGRKFITFPKGVMSIEFTNDNIPEREGNTLGAWTADGLNVYVEVSFFAVLNQTKIGGLYFDCGNKWYAFIVRLAIGAIKEVTVKYQTTDFFEKRTAIATDMLINIQKKYSEFLRDAVKITDIQLRKTSFDSDYDNAIRSKLIQLQSQKIFTIKRSTQNITKNNELLTIRANNYILNINATAKATGDITVANASSLAYKYTIQNETDLYKTLAGKLELDTNWGLLQFIYTNNLINLNTTKNFMFGPRNVLFDLKN